MRILTLAATLSLMAASTASAAPISQSLSVSQGFNLQAGNQSPVGYIVSMAFGSPGPALAADFVVRTPMGTNLAVVAVLDSVSWNGGILDPLVFNGYVSTANKQALGLLTTRGIANPAVQFQFVTYQYDPYAKKWFASFQNVTTPLTGLLQKVNNAWAIQVGTAPGPIASPQNWPLAISIVPAQLAQTLQFRASTTAAVTKQWGITVSAQ